MKKTLLILLLLAGVSLKGKAQHFIASFGVERSWDVPVMVSRVIYDDYYGYDWVHATRVYQNGGLFFNVILQRQDVFVEVTIDNGGYITREVVRDYYPLHDHICNEFCGYHASYYHTHYHDCHSHDHFGHNHVVYTGHPHGHAYGYYRNNPYYVYNSHIHGYERHSYGNQWKHDDYHGNSKHSNNQYDRRGDNDGYRNRRDRYYDSQRDNHWNDHDNENRKGRAGDNRHRYASGTYVRGSR